jgi:hypothetical protein
MNNGIDLQKLKKSLSKLQDHFVANDFGGTEKLTAGKRLSEAEIRNAILEYPDKLHGFNWDSLDAVKVNDPTFGLWSVDIRFRTAARAASDLTLRLPVRDAGTEFYSIEILDIHVL